MSQNKQYEGTITISGGKKMGFFDVPDFDEDVVITEDNLNHALFGDTVKIQMLPDKVEIRKEWKHQAKVIEIISRAQTRFVGVLEQKDGKYLVNTDSRRMHVPIELGKEVVKDIPEGHKIYVEITGWLESEQYPHGSLIEDIGPKGEHEVEIKAIVLEKGIVADFPPEVEAEANKFEAKFAQDLIDDLPNRRDIRDRTTFTIDPESAKDFDDALSIHQLENGNYEIGIHIADVSYFVRPGTELDKEAFDRAFSVYLVDRTIPMLPEVLSNGLCSLNPHVDRFSFSAIFEMNLDGEVLDEWFGRTIINSNRRFSYEEAQEQLNAVTKDPSLTEDYAQEIKTMNDISLKLTEKKLSGGAIRFEKDEFAFELDAKGVPLRIYKKEHIRTHVLIEEFMLLANRHVAKFIHDKCENSGGNCELMYRVHNEPEAEKISELMQLVKALGYKLELNKEGAITPQALNGLLKQVHGKPEESLVSTAAIRTMSKALYSTTNSGHFGLAFEYYTHFTSPIRRYPDLIVHRILQTLLSGENLTAKDGDYNNKAAQNSSDQEVNAQQAERESIKFKQVEFMTNHVGESFDGIVSGVAPFGAFVILDDTGAEGMVHISKLGQDFWNYDEKNFAIVGEKTGKKVRLGDRIRVTIESADIDERKLSLIPATK